MNLSILKSCFAAGARRSAGDVIEIADAEANQLLAMGRVEVAPAPKPEVETVDRAVLPKSTRKAKEMKIELKKGSSMGRDGHKSGYVTDAPDAVAKKLIARGYAVEYVKQEERAC